MELPRLLQCLNDPAAYPRARGRPELRQTHISVVAILDDWVYKIRKPVRTAFLDFSTLALRLEDCQEEVRLNRRLAPKVYEGVVPLCWDSGKLQVEGPGEIIEWAVKMRRLPNDATMLARLGQQCVSESVLQTLAQRIAAFHELAESRPEMAPFGRADAVIQNAQENLNESRAWIGSTISPAVWEALQREIARHGQELAPLLNRRAENGQVRDTHGDLHLDHIYWFPDRQPPDDFVIIDCIEFNARFRYADPIADIAFVLMDLGFRGYPELGDVVRDAYLQAAMDEQGRQLLPFYVAYRSAVRAKVESMVLAEPEQLPDTRQQAGKLARAHWLFALGQLATAQQKPALLLFGGLPGTGKSTLARSLMTQAGFTVIRSDVVRKDLAAEYPDLPLYGSVMSRHTYEACYQQAEAALFAGQRVIVDANFPQDEQRLRFQQLARELAVPGFFVHCHVPPQVAHDRLATRRGDASDADVRVYQRLADAWEPLGPATACRAWLLDSSGSPDDALTKLTRLLVQHHLA